MTFSVLEKRYSDNAYSDGDSIAYVGIVGDSVVSYSPHSYSINLLYNFALVAGDTLTVNGPNSGNSYYLGKGDSISEFRVVIDSTDLITIDGVQCRVQYSSPLHLSEGQYIGCIIEKVGNISQLFGYNSTIILAGYIGSLACYSEPGFHFGLPLSACNDLITSISSENSVEQITVYPNPSNGFITVAFENNGQKIKSIQIYDPYGKVMYEESDLRFGSKEHHIIAISSLKPGIYFLEITGEKQKVVRKIIRTR